ncbi:hypothetical protein BGZ60DRAFT_422803, partial [Tricladium varicosporioides]
MFVLQSTAIFFSFPSEACTSPVTKQGKTFTIYNLQRQPTALPQHVSSIPLPHTIVKPQSNHATKHPRIIQFTPRYTRYTRRAPRHTRITLFLFPASSYPLTI